MAMTIQINENISIQVYFDRANREEGYNDDICFRLIETGPKDYRIFAADETAFSLTCEQAEQLAYALRMAVKEGRGTLPPYTPKQGQYLAFIYHYTQINKRPPAEIDIQRYFRVTPPTVHQMILRLESAGFITREPGQARSIQVLLAPDQLPYLE